MEARKNIKSINSNFFQFRHECLGTQRENTGHNQKTKISKTWQIIVIVFAA